MEINDVERQTKVLERIAMNAARHLQQSGPASRYAGGIVHEFGKRKTGLYRHCTAMATGL